MAIKVFSFGKIDKKSYGDDIDRYIKMMQPWSKTEMVTLKGKTIGSSAQKDALLAQEAQQLLKGIRPSTTICSLAEEGTTMTTEAFAQWLGVQLSTQGDIRFLIGSAYGLDEELKKNSDLLLSLLPMTMPYKLARLVFVEQLYRALSVLQNHPYHKE